MKNQSSITTILTILVFVLGTVSAFAPGSLSLRTFGRSSLPTMTGRKPLTPSLNMFFGAKDDGSPGDYVCKDCGYVFAKGPKAWAALDDRKYQCPPCGAPKFRFKKVPKGSAKGKVAVKKSW
eukprot:CAMPEP_0113297098 /NCGR_PEP_ID=MMETSP0010_2-20120614/101_1 /TAXON_ID=216773 ORGANISM="Corethron hystrix, Strain 308" /NCGR_SAMPLE_ID=MMETSP0010_2 /ASSEMBLY_ACC=CAM_ASM_000155 /LENGTH=121 /DNA_ID=CAMNT_0000149929 /DNA_START=257 /DNA_END=619 /DNA_ORIENTATION=+ /assembly_acc=CAM_ASM_000155